MSGHLMNVRLSPSHQKWLTEQVSSGAFPSIDAAQAWAIEGMMPLANDDLEWARPSRLGQSPRRGPIGDVATCFR